MLRLKYPKTVLVSWPASDPFDKPLVAYRCSFPFAAGSTINAVTPLACTKKWALKSAGLDTCFRQEIHNCESQIVFSNLEEGNISDILS